MLRLTPPREPRGIVPRTELSCLGGALHDFPVLVVQAPPGFGKTSLMLQWRKTLQGAGVAAGWLAAQEQDHPARLVCAVTLALRMASGRPDFGRASLAFDGGTAIEHLTVLLGEVGHLARDTALLIDEAERLPSASRRLLTYLLRQAPPNLRVLVAARTDCIPGVDELIAYDQCRRIDAEALRFDLDDALRQTRLRLGAQADPDLAARLLTLSEGWPLGFQMALSSLERGGDLCPPQVDSRRLLAGLHQQFETLVLAALSPEDRAFLVRVSVLDKLHPALCEAMTGDAQAGRRLVGMLERTPIFMGIVGTDWARMHGALRQALRVEFRALPGKERQAMHGRAADWLAAEGFFDEAARHALQAGRQQQGYELAERGFQDALWRDGRQAEVLAWLQEMPGHELRQRPGLLWILGWAQAASERHAEARVLVESLPVPAENPARFQCEAALLLSAAAVFADDPDRYLQLVDGMSPPTALPAGGFGVLSARQLRLRHANRQAQAALLRGEPARARHLLSQPWGIGGADAAAEEGSTAAELGYTGHWARLLEGLSHVWEGRVEAAVCQLRPALRKAENELGRRHRLSCMLAALLAAAAWESDRVQEAQVLLADRLDVLARTAMPDILLLAYRSAARMALVQGAESRALALLGALEAAATTRGLPRVQIGSLVEQVRLHARNRRAQTCGNLCERIDERIAALSSSLGEARPLWLAALMALQDQARAYAAIAAHDWLGALGPLERAERHAAWVSLGRLHIELMALRALVLARTDRDARPLLEEALSLARSHGLQRVLRDAHPEVPAWLKRIGLLAAQEGPAMDEPAAVPMGDGPHGGMLTPKEHEVLVLLARHLSNKEIARVMNVGETTVKWHIRNLFTKLGAGSRRQVVQRARLLGLIELP